MDRKYVVEPLNAQKHDRAAFSCGVPPLDAYLKTQATQDAKRNIAVTYVLREQNASAIIGYYSLSAATIEPTQLPEEIARRLPRYEALPAVLIRRLAVHRQYQGQGVGSLLLVNALRRCLKLSQQIGAMAVLVDAKDEQAAHFYERYGFRRFMDTPLKLYMPMAEIRQLA